MFYYISYYITISVKGSTTQLNYNRMKPYHSQENNPSCSNPNPIVRNIDYGPYPYVVNIEEITNQNSYYRTTEWTGAHLQLTLMCIPVGGDIGLERHPDVDQFIRLESGEGIVRMGDREDRLNYQAKVTSDYAFIVPAGTWHNLINVGDTPLKLYSIYAPPQHPHGTIHKTKEEAQHSE